MTAVELKSKISIVEYCFISLIILCSVKLNDSELRNDPIIDFKLNSSKSSRFSNKEDIVGNSETFSPQTQKNFSTLKMRDQNSKSNKFKRKFYPLIIQNQLITSELAHNSVKKSTATVMNLVYHEKSENNSQTKPLFHSTVDCKFTDHIMKEQIKSYTPKETNIIPTKSDKLLPALSKFALDVPRDDRDWPVRNEESRYKRYSVDFSRQGVGAEESRGNDSNTVYTIQLKPYPPLATLGPYGENWFPEAYKNNHRRKDKSSTGSPGVEIVSLTFPSLIREGDNISLFCNFRLLGYNQKVYTVNWWRGQDQFFTFGKGNIKNLYSFPGIKVDEAHSRKKSVVLLGVSDKTSGEYKCEVMTEGPAFRTAVMYKNLTVVVPPASLDISASTPKSLSSSTGGPNRKKLEGKYKLGEKVQMNCTAKEMKPKSKLIWKINGREVSPTVNFPDRNHAEGLVTSSIGISFITPHYFNRDGECRVSCSVKVNGLLLTSTRVTLKAEVRTMYSFSILNSSADNQKCFVSISNLYWLIFLYKILTFRSGFFLN